MISGNVKVFLSRMNAKQGAVVVQVLAKKKKYVVNVGQTIDFRYYVKWKYFVREYKRHHSGINLSDSTLVHYARKGKD